MNRPEIRISRIEIDENTSREELVQEIIYLTISNENLYDKLQYKGQVIDALSDRVRDKEQIILALNKYIEKLEKQYRKKR